jgi:O-antigen/teichoic acid export membrane protein
MNAGIELIKKYWKEHEILRVFTAVFSVDAFVKGSTLLLLPVYLKLMTEAEFGMYNYLLSVVGIYVSVLGFGLNNAQSKMYFNSDDPTERGKVMFILNLLLLILLSISLIILYFTKFDFYITKLLIKNPIRYENYRNSIFFTIVGLVFYSMLINYFLLEKEIKKLQVYNIVRVIFINSMIILLFVYLKTDKVLIRFFYTALIEMVILSVFYFYYVRKMIFGIDLKTIKTALSIGIPFAAATVPAVLIGFADKFYVEKLTTAHNLSVYYLALNISFVIPAVFASLQNVWLPFFYGEKNISANFRKTKRLISNMIAVFLVLSVILFIGTATAFEFHIFDPKFADILFILPITLITQILISAGVILGNYLIFFNKTYIHLIVNLIMLFPIFYLTKILAEHFGVYGAAFSMLIYSLIYIFLYLLIILYFYKKNSFRTTE